MASKASGGVGFFGLLFLILLTLKLLGKIEWSWWWVTAPLWGGIALWFILFLLLMGYIVVKSANRLPKRRF